VAVVVEEHALGDLQDQLPRIHPAGFGDGQHQFGEVTVLQLDPGDVDGEGPRGVFREPGLQLGAALQEDLGADLDDQAAALRRRDELLGRDGFAVALPAGQRLDLHHHAEPGRDDRLVMHGDLAGVHGHPQPGLQLGALHE
jgi:hypothetical protein